jgi:ComF family protein
MPVAQSIALLPFSEPAVQAAITENKFHRNHRAAQLLADSLTQWVATNQEPTILIPMPLARLRAKTRGYNQVHEVLKRVAAPNARIETQLLIRVKETQPQTSLKRVDRKKNVRGAFAVAKLPLHTITPVRYVLVDDVLTTGATMAAARAALAPHVPPNTSLITLALAH